MTIPIPFRDAHDFVIDVGDWLYWIGPYWSMRKAVVSRYGYVDGSPVLFVKLPSGGETYWFAEDARAATLSTGPELNLDDEQNVQTRFVYHRRLLELIAQEV